jgi:hypothetical protein
MPVQVSGAGECFAAVLPTRESYWGRPINVDFDWSSQIDVEDQQLQRDDLCGCLGERFDQSLASPPQKMSARLLVEMPLVQFRFGARWAEVRRCLEVAMQPLEQSRFASVMGKTAIL